MYRSIYAVTIRPKSLYEDVHASTGHPGYTGMQWHQKNTIGANYTDKDAAAPRGICQGCALGSAHQYPTNQHYVMSDTPHDPGQQFVVDAFTHHSVGHSGFVYAHLFTDLASRQVYPVFTKSKLVTELTTNMSELFYAHPDWKPNGSVIDRKIKVDMEAGYQSAEFREFCHSLGYRIESSPTRDKHAHGVAERSVGNIVTKANIAMLGNISHPCPQTFWPDAILYACHCDGFGYKNKIGTSPYFYINQRHIHLKYLHPFWTPVYFTVPAHERKQGKLGQARALKGFFVGYSYAKYLQPCYRVVARYANGTYGRVRITKDVIFDLTINFKSDLEIDLPTQGEFNSIPSLELVHDQDNADALRRQLIMSPAIQEVTVPPTISEPTPHIGHSDAPSIPPADPYLPSDADVYNDADIGTKYDEDGNLLYWYNMRLNLNTDIKDGNPYPAEFGRVILETQHYRNTKLLCALEVKDPRVPTSYDKAVIIPLWAAAITTELGKFRDHNCLVMTPFTGQHLVPMKWIFSIKTDGTYKARLVGRGDLMIPWVDFNPKEIYCGNITACGIKLVLAIAASYKLRMRGGDLVGAYLVTRANKDYPVYIKTPKGMEVEDGYCIQAVGNLYGFPPAGQNFSIEFDKCVMEMGYVNTPWDLKLFYKWINDKPIFVIAHSDDFRWFGSENVTHEWDALIKNFNKHKYTVTDCTDKEFVGINITHDEHYNYYMDQTRMITEIIKEANLTGAKEEKLPYPMGNSPLSKNDCATEDQKQECTKYPYRRVVGQLMYGMVHTLITIMYALNILSRYGNNPGPRHIEFLKHLLKYCKYAKLDRLKFPTHNGPTDIETMTQVLQLKFQCDADLGGNPDNGHSQTSYIGYLGQAVICWCSTDQGSVSTSTAESEIKAVNHTLKAEVISNRGIMNAIGWIQKPTIIQEDNQACVYASEAKHMTRNLRHLELAQLWFKEKVADGTCIIEKVDSKENNSDIGTKRVPKFIFEYLTHKLVDKSLRTNI